MHLLAAQPGGFVDEEGIIDLQQSPADIVILSAADSNLAALATAAETLPDHYPSVRLANFLQLTKPAAFDLYQDKVIDHASVVVLSLLGGESYWSYGLERLVEWQRITGKTLIVVPGDDSEDITLFNKSSESLVCCKTVWQFLRQGGASNSEHLYHFLTAHYFNHRTGCENVVWREPQVLPHAMIYASALLDQPRDTSTHVSQMASLQQWEKYWQDNPSFQGPAQRCLLLFYRSHLQSANTEVFEQLLVELMAVGLQALPVAISSLKDAESIYLVNHLLDASDAKLVINTTGFAANTVAAPDLSAEPTDYQNYFNKTVPVFQLILSGSTIDDWQSYQQGLRSRDIAMQVVLPEMDGRIITRAISFKAESYFSERCETSVIRYTLHRERAAFVAQLIANYFKLVVKHNREKRIALMLANYPTNDGRIGNGVGLDTPASTMNILKALKAHDFPVDAIPEDGNALISELLAAVTNNPNTLHFLPCWQSIAVDDYLAYFALLPQVSQQAVWERWGPPENDPKFRQGRLMIAGIRLGETFVGIQPARGFNIDLSANYHDPDLIPPHAYLACYFWLRYQYQVDAIVHVGKHGNLEWLPGKGTALSDQCWPDIVLGPVPHFYPFIVNDPGEGAQAKRRAHAVIIDHLMPPLTRAETYGDIAELEALVDECYQAMSMDARREAWLRKEIVKKIKQSNVLQELSLNPADSDNDDELLAQLDAYLCDIKEAQIRHGLHRLGELPEHEKLADTIVALLRLPRGQTAAAQGILHSLVGDLKLYHNGELFDPFAPLNDGIENWLSAKPECLVLVSDQLWRTTADTKERLELYAQQLILRFMIADNALEEITQQLPNTTVLLRVAKQQLWRALQQSADQEISALMNGLQGLFVEPGPSGAPSRGRLDTLPTGRNFFSVDNRSIPSPAAWALGQKSAQALIERHLQEHGDFPLQLGLSVWGTATMRTGGDDIAQAFALMGIKPLWAEGSQRVVDFEIIPQQLLGRPRVDVMLRISGFFRDAFPNVIKLYDAAVQAIADFDDPGGNTISHNIAEQQQQLIAEGMAKDQAKRESSYRVFGSKPGAYGAGLQGLIDERCWEQSSDLMEAYVNWGGYAYGNEAGDGQLAKQAFVNRLSQLEAVVQNQDNREHDLLDSDDYYQFQGGMTNAIRNLKGEMPVVYHNDHANPAAPKVRTLKEELNRVVRSRVLNPKWIGAMREHGYKGAFEMAASIDYLFAYDATTDYVDDYQYVDIAEALIFDHENQQFLRENNINALEEMTERMLEACQRGLWKEPEAFEGRLQDLLLDITNSKESTASR